MNRPFHVMKDSKALCKQVELLGVLYLKPIYSQMSPSKAWHRVLVLSSTYTRMLPTIESQLICFGRTPKCIIILFFKISRCEHIYLLRFFVDCALAHATSIHCSWESWRSKLCWQVLLKALNEWKPIIGLVLLDSKKSWRISSPLALFSMQLDEKSQNPIVVQKYELGPWVSMLVTVGEFAFKPRKIVSRIEARTLPWIQRAFALNDSQSNLSPSQCNMRTTIKYWPNSLRWCESTFISRSYKAPLTTVTRR